MVFCQQLGCEIEELNVQQDHVHLLVKVPPKLSISELMGVLKGRTAIRLYTQFPSLRRSHIGAITFGARAIALTLWGSTVR